MESSPSTSETTMPAPPMGRPHSDHVTENGNESLSVLRFLISNATAGSIIGKGGTAIRKLQAQAGIKIQLSRNHEYFPGTNERVACLSGALNQILEAFKLILLKIHGEGEDLESKCNQVRLVFPHMFCGAIIGKGGATIRTFMEESGTVIKLTSPENVTPGCQDRIVSVAGSFDGQMLAVTLITKKVSKDASYAQYASGCLDTGMPPQEVQQRMLQGPFTSTPPVGSFTYGPMPYNDYHTKGVMTPYMAMHTTPFPLQQLPVYSASTPIVFTVIAVPDEGIGAILGRGGKTILDIQQSTGVHIRISDRGDYVPGTTQRKVTITGRPECIYAAQQVLMQKISQSQSFTSF